MVKSNNRSNWQKKATLHVQPLFCTFLHRCFARRTTWNFQKHLRACLRGGGGPQIGEVTCGGLPHPTYKSDHIKKRLYKQAGYPTKAGYLTYLGLDCKTVRIFGLFTVREGSQTKGLERGWKQRARLGRDAKNTDCPFCIRYIRSNYPLLPATGNSPNWLNLDASCQQAVK